jgi:hypothetical protein
VWKHKYAATVTASAPRKTSKRCGRGRRSSHSGAQTSAQKLALAKALKPSKKFAVKACVAGVKATGKKTFCTSAGGSGVTHDPKCVLNLLGSNLLAAPLEWLRKHSKETPLAKDIPKSSVSKGIFEEFIFLCCYVMMLILFLFM